MQKIALLVLFVLCSLWSVAQEMEFQVTVNTPKLQTTDPKVFENLETALQEWLNNQKWSNDVFEPEERIKCNIQLTIKAENGVNSFSADLAIQSARPVYGSTYETALLSHVDRDLAFTYEQFQPLEFSRNVFNDNLTSVMAFYVYIILGMDYDSFSPLGGEVHFNIAQDILTTIPPDAAGRYKGWRALDHSNRNRYWMIENLLTPRVRPYREAMYEYHRQGLDLMHKNTDFARAKLMTCLETALKVNQAYPNAMVLQMFANAKSSEIVEVFKLGTKAEKSRVYAIMSKIDAAGASKYLAIGK